MRKTGTIFGRSTLIGGAVLSVIASLPAEAAKHHSHARSPRVVVVAPPPPVPVPVPVVVAPPPPLYPYYGLGPFGPNPVGLYGY